MMPYWSKASPRIWLACFSGKSARENQSFHAEKRDEKERVREPEQANDEVHRDQAGLLRVARRDRLPLDAFRDGERLVDDEHGDQADHHAHHQLDERHAALASGGEALRARAHVS